MWKNVKFAKFEKLAPNTVVFLTKFQASLGSGCVRSRIKIKVCCMSVIKGTHDGGQNTVHAYLIYSYPFLGYCTEDFLDCRR